MGYQPIENYGIIGDLNTVALIGLNGSIDFLCLPHFDSPTISARAMIKQNFGYKAPCSKMLGYANHLGLFSGQLGFRGEHLGNFLQAFSHLGLISAAFNPDKQLNNSRNKNVNHSM